MTILAGSFLESGQDFIFQRDAKYLRASANEFRLEGEQYASMKGVK